MTKFTLATKPAPVPLRAAENGPILAYLCGLCDNVYPCRNDPEFARSAMDRCCPPHRCDDCSGERPASRAYCLSCERKRDRAALAARITKAKHFINAADWLLPVHVEGLDENGWHRTVGDLREEYADGANPLPSWVWGCSIEHLHLDAETILEQATCDIGSESAEEEAQAGSDDLQGLLTVWSKAHPVSWWEEDEVVVVLDRERFEAELLALTPVNEAGQ